MSSRSHLSPAIALSISLLSCGGGSYNSCFAAGTLISTPAGPVAIEEIRVGQVVYAFDEARAARVTSTVREVFVHEDTAFDQLVLSDGSVLGVTGEHPVYLPDLGRYVEARTLRSGDALLLLDERGESGPGFRRETVARGLPAAAASRGTVYNFAVERNENYFANGVLVHNKSPSCTTGCIPSSTMTITVRIARSGDGGGSIKASGGGRSEVSCANDLCHLPVTFVEGKETYVFLRATPDAQSHLAGWAGGCEGHPICALMVNKDQTDYAVSAQLSLCTRGKFCPRYQTGYSQLASFHGAAAVGNTLWVTASPVSDSNSSMKGSALWTLSGTELVPYEEPSAPRQDLFGIASSSQGEAWAVGVNGSAYSLSGSSWTLRQSTTVRRLSGVFASPQQTWVVGDAGTILRWQPSTWTPEPSLTTVNLHGVWAASASAAWAVGEQGTIL